MKTKILLLALLFIPFLSCIREATIRINLKESIYPSRCIGLSDDLLEKAVKNIKVGDTIWVISDSTYDPNHGNRWRVLDTETEKIIGFKPKNDTVFMFGNDSYLIKTALFRGVVTRKTKWEWF